MRAMDTVELLQMFARIVETGSFTSVARERRLTQPTVSKRLQQLEQTFGARLLERNTQGVRPTEAGERLYVESRALLERFENLRTSIISSQAGGLTGQLVLSVPIAFGQHVLSPLLVAFHAEHPLLKIQMSLADRAVDLVEDGVDVAVRMGLVRSAEVVARRLGSVRFCLVATPRYLKREGKPSKVEDLTRHAYLIPDVSRDEELVHPGGTFSFKTRGWLSVSNSGALKEAVMLSAGLGRLPRYLVEQELKKKQLIEVLPGVAPEPMPVSAVYLGGKAAAPKVRALVAFLTQALPSQPGMLPP